MLGEWLSGIGIALSGAGFTLAGIFRCDAGCRLVGMSPDAIIHNQAAFGAFLIAIVSALVLLVGCVLRKQGLRGAVSAMALLGMVGGLGSMIALGTDHALIGIAQRVFLFTYCGWLIADSMLVFRTSRRANA